MLGEEGQREEFDYILRILWGFSVETIKDRENFWITFFIRISESTD